jgi:hypothetical protein
LHPCHIRLYKALYDVVGTGFTVTSDNDLEFTLGEFKRRVREVRALPLGGLPREDEQESPGCQ